MGTIYIAGLGINKQIGNSPFAYNRDQFQVEYYTCDVYCFARRECDAFVDGLAPHLFLIDGSTLLSYDSIPKLAEVNNFCPRLDLEHQSLQRQVRDLPGLAVP